MIQVMNADSVVVFSFTRTLAPGASELAAGGRVRISGRIENSLVPGNYFLDCWVRRDRASRATWRCRACACSTSWSSARTPREGVVSVNADVEAVPGGSAP